MGSEDEKPDDSAVKIVDRRRFNEEGDLKAGAIDQRNSREDGVVGSGSNSASQSRAPESSQNDTGQKLKNKENQDQAQPSSKGEKDMKGSTKSQVEANSEYSASTLDFSTFVMGLAHQAFILLGKVEDPYTGETKVNIEGARQTIDTIAILEEKTKGNLTSDEQRLVNEALAGLRMEFVKTAKNEGSA